MDGFRGFTRYAKLEVRNDKRHNFWVYLERLWPAGRLGYERIMKIKMTVRFSADHIWAQRWHCMLRRLYFMRSDLHDGPKKIRSGARRLVANSCFEANKTKYKCCESATHR